MVSSPGDDSNPYPKSIEGGIDTVRNGQLKFLLDFFFACLFQVTFFAALETGTRFLHWLSSLFVCRLTIESFSGRRRLAS